MDQAGAGSATETEADRARRLAEAAREHERIEKVGIAMFPAIISFAVESLKAAALVNGGSAAAMLAFIGTGRQPVTLDTILGLKLFGVGLVAAVIATALAYLAQYLYLQDVQYQRPTWHPPFRQATTRSKWSRRVAAAFHALGIFATFGAYGCALAGLLYVAGGLVPMPAKP